MNIDPKKSGGSYSGEARIAFDPPFASAPHVSVTPQTSSPDSVHAAALDAGPGGATVLLVRANKAATAVRWLAVGPRA